MQVGFIVFEYCEKDDLFAYVKSGVTRGNLKLCRSLFYQILLGVAHLHDQCGLSHSDLKLENIVLSGDTYTPKLIDFAFSEQGLISNTRGTEQYLAPEQTACMQAKGKMLYDGKQADVFSLGILLFTMYFGMPPFKQNTIENPLL